MISQDISRHGADPAALIEVLHQVQLRDGYLAAGALHQVARELRLPLSRVFGVASFYHLFRLSPPALHHLALCHGTACFVNGAEQLESVLRARCAVGEAAPVHLEPSASLRARSQARSRHGGPLEGSAGWRLERSGCLGACGLHPVLRIADGPVLPMPLMPAASLVDRLAALGVPLLP